MGTTTSSQDLARSMLSVLFMVGLIGASFWILRPFLPAVIWASMIVVATWPLMLRAQALLWGKRALAVTAMMLALLLVFMIPFSLAVGTFVAHIDEIVDWAQSLKSLTLPPPPDWVEGLPLVGPKTASAWRRFASSGPEELARVVSPYARSAAGWFLSELGSLGVIAGQFLVTVVIAAVLFACGETAVTNVYRFGRRLAGERGEQAVRLAGQAIRGIAMGVVLVAIGQAALGGIGLAVAGVPFAVLLTAVMFLLAVVQIGVVPVLACAVAWLYWQGMTGWGTALLFWTIFVGTIDNVVRPLLIKRGAQMPLLLVFAGVVGGLIAFGLVGIFVGPVVLGVSYMLLEAWVQEEPEAGVQPSVESPQPVQSNIP